MKSGLGVSTGKALWNARVDGGGHSGRWFEGYWASGVKVDTIFGVGQVMTNLSSRLKQFHSDYSDLSFMGFDQLSCPWSTSPARTSILSLEQIVRTPKIVFNC